MSNRLDKERGPLCETSLDQKRIAVLLLVCKWSRVCVDVLGACLLCAVATPRGVCSVCVCVGVSVVRVEGRMTTTTAAPGSLTVQQQTVPR